MPYNMFQLKYTMFSPVWQYMPMVLALRELKHRIPVLKVMLGHVASLCLKKPKPKQTNKTNKTKNQIYNAYI